jgi:hypothetical protein
MKKTPLKRTAFKKKIPKHWTKRPDSLVLPLWCELCARYDIKTEFPLTEAHRHEVDEYINYPELRWIKNQVATICTQGYPHNDMDGCHTFIDTHKDKRKELFTYLRGPDEHPNFKIQE